MFSSISLRKAVRLSTTTVVAGAAVAFVFLGGPADAATVVRVIQHGRGY